MTTERCRRLLIGGGLSELEAAGEIDRFVFEVRHAVEHGAEFRLDGFGVMKPGPNGTIAFVFESRIAGGCSRNRRQGACGRREAGTRR